MIRLDIPRASVDRLARKITAVARTIEMGQQAEVYLDKRPRREGDRGHITNAEIARKSRRRGADPFELPVKIRQDAHRIAARGLKRAIARAVKTGQPTPWGASMLGAAQHVARFFRTRITSGRLGSNRRVTADIKRQLVKAGRATSRWGTPPPYMVSSGRFVSSIRARLMRGRHGRR